MYTLQPGFNQNYPQLGHQPQQQIIYSNKKLEHINCVIRQTQQQGGLYIGDTISTLRFQHIQNNKIEAILCLNSEAAKNAYLTKAHFDYRYIQIQDHPDYPIKLHFQSSNQFIHKQIKNKKNVLVQCHGGISRSATIICAYLIKYKKWIPQQAILYLKQRRHRAKPNAGFWKQLQQYWSQLYMKINPEDQVNFKTPKKINKDYNLKSIKEHEQRTYEKQQKTTAGKSQKQIYNPKKQLNFKQQRERSKNKSLSKYLIPHTSIQNRECVSLRVSLSKTQNTYQFSPLNRTVPVFRQPIQVQQSSHHHQNYHSPQHIMPTLRTQPSQTLYSPYIPKNIHQSQNNLYTKNYQNNNGQTLYSPYVPQHIHQSQNNLYTKNYQNNNGFIRRL